jgi:hypothetical protein
MSHETKPEWASSYLQESAPPLSRRARRFAWEPRAEYGL